MAEKKKSETRKMNEAEKAKSVTKQKKTKKNPKKWNLVLLGVISVVIAGVTTGISLLIYHNSGDIYLDRSRPGYLPDEAEVVEEEKAEDYKFEKSGEMTMGELEKYEEELKNQVEEMGTEEKPFDAKALTDKALGI